jgi:hypothetical protein
LIGYLFRHERRLAVLIALAAGVRAQDLSPSAPPVDPAAVSSSEAPPSVHEKWRHFVDETWNPFTPFAAAFNAGVSQATRSTPLYGRDPWPSAYPKRVGASLGDIVSQNFFADFLLASAFHEDTRYKRRGESHKLWPRIGYAISRAVVARTDSGNTTFNFANVLGTGMSAALSNAYYPPESQHAAAAASNWGTSLVGSGLVNLMPEFMPDLKRWWKHRRH